MIIRSSSRILLYVALTLSLFLITDVMHATEISDAMLEEFQADAETSFTAEAGLATWYAKQADGRSCTSCHGESLFATGSHQKTGKRIEPMAPSVNPERLTERRKINKWFLRNCKWTYGRECTPQEKGDMLLWLSQQ